MKIISKRQNGKMSRKNVRQGIRSGDYALRVVGSEKAGFKLAGQRGEVVVMFGQTYKKQMQAVEFGNKRFGQTAKKVVLGVVARPSTGGKAA